MTVRGRVLLSGLPKTFTLSSFEIRDALAEPVAAVVDTVRIALERTPPELSADIMEKGILMAGGGSLLHGLANHIMEETEIPIYRAEDPLSCVAVGTGKVLEMDLFSSVSSTISQRA
jgi:rod shape-determining protein MreB